jgi:phosphoribosylanthranilate isomerase
MSWQRLKPSAPPSARMAAEAPAQVKICGLRDEAAIAAAVRAGVHYIGFVFYPPSPRHLSIAQAASLRAHVPQSVKLVAVCVSPDDALVEALVQQVQPDFLQLHGNESPERFSDIRRRWPQLALIQSIAISQAADVEQAQPYSESAMLLFDAKPPADAALPGGNGLSFDWKLMAGKSFPKPWMLSGGLTPANVAQAMRESGAHMVDVSSGVESAPGVKDAALIDAFVKAARSL